MEPAFLVVESWRHPRLIVPLDGPTVVNEFVIEPRDGTWFAGELALEHGTHVVHHRTRMTFLVGDREQALADLRHASTTIDPLTRLANRRTLRRYLARLSAPTVAIVDIDHMKRINDYHGMTAGDAVLVATARRLRAEVRWPVLLARWGGEEFVAAFPALARDAVLAVAERMRRACEPPIAFEGESIVATISIGVDGDLRGAEDRLQRAKVAGRNRVD